MQLPCATSVSVVPLTVQTLVVLLENTTVSPDAALADNVRGDAEIDALASAAKLIV